MLESINLLLEMVLHRLNLFFIFHNPLSAKSTDREMKSASIKVPFLSFLFMLILQQLVYDGVPISSEDHLISTGSQPLPDLPHGLAIKQMDLSCQNFNRFCDICDRFQPHSHLSFLDFHTCQTTSF